MTLRKLQSLGTYEEINGGAHRKAASIVGIPSMIRHLGFWNTGFSIPIKKPRANLPILAGQGGNGGEGDGTGSALSSAGLPDSLRKESFRRYVDNLKSIIEGKDSPTLEPDSESFVLELGGQVDTGTVTLIRFWWQTMRTTVRLEYHTEYITVTSTTVRLEYHTEYITVTSIIDASVKPRPGEAVGSAGQTFDEVRERLASLKKLFETCPRDLQEEYDLIGPSLQEQIWSDFDDQVLDRKIGAAPILGTQFGEIFLDSRGIVIGSRAPEDNEIKKHPQCKNLMPQILREPFQYELPRRRSRRTIVHDLPGRSWAREMVERIWPFVESERHPIECEFTVAGFLQGRVLFITALGPQSSGTAGNKEGWTPIRYFLHSFTDDEWQLGRLVDRINTLGTLRLAATMEIEGLRAVSEPVETLASEIEEAGDLIQIALQKIKDDSGSRKQEEEAARRAETQLLKVARTYQKINDRVSGDIAHRLERSQYYFERFAKESRGLRQTRIEGFQSYTEFVSRRMSSIFGYIQFIRTRMESIDSSNSNLIRQYSSLKITKVTRGIDGLVSVLNAQNAKMQEQEKEIGKIQEFGEIALIGALIPYYLGYTIVHGLELQGFWARVVWAAAVVICSTIVLFRIKWQGTKSDESRKRLEPIFLIFIAYLVIAFAATVPALIAEAYAGRSAATTSQQDEESAGHAPGG